jgi:hypothetical protein
MTNRIPAAPAAALARAPAGLTASATKRSLRELALACLLLAGYLTSSTGPSLAASDEKAPPKSDATVAKPATVGPTVVVVHSNSLLLQRLRQAIAEMLEANAVYRTAFNVKLVDAKFSGPNVKIIHSLFSSSTSEDRYYCVKVGQVFPYMSFPWPKTAVVRFKQAENGSEVLQARIDANDTDFWCKRVNYVPFPEIEQLRAKRRKVLGKTD